MLYHVIWYYKKKMFNSVLPEDLAFKFNDYLNNHPDDNFGCCAIILFH